MSLESWFFKWMEYHQILHPGKWRDPFAPEAAMVFSGWLQEFDRFGITHEEAEQASRDLQAKPPRYTGNVHLDAIKTLVLNNRRAQRAVSSKVQDARSDGCQEAAECSRDCPECQGSGWAIRWIEIKGVRSSFPVDLFCRCPMGRWRKVHDPELRRPQGVRNHDDLQARPELWLPGLTHSTWDLRPCGHDMEDLAHANGVWRYYLPGEDRPPTADPSVLARRIESRPARPVPNAPPVAPDVAEAAAMF